MEIALQGKLRRRQDASVHTVGLPAPVIREELYLASCGWSAGFRKIAEPVSWREEHKHENENHRDVVLPRAALVRPEKNLRENLPRACHISLRVRRRR